MTCLAPKFSSFLHRHCHKHSQMCKQMKMQLLCDVCGLQGLLWLHDHKHEGTMILQNVVNNPTLAQCNIPQILNLLWHHFDNLKCWTLEVYALLITYSKRQNLWCVIPFFLKKQSHKVLTSIFTFIYLFGVGHSDFTIVNLGLLFLGHTGWHKSEFCLYQLAITYCTMWVTILSKNLTLWYIMSDTPTQCGTQNAERVQPMAYCGLY
jgi:hypothetical protein